MEGNKQNKGWSKEVERIREKMGQYKREMQRLKREVE